MGRSPGMSLANDPTFRSRAATRFLNAWPAKDSRWYSQAIRPTMPPSRPSSFSIARARPRRQRWMRWLGRSLEPRRLVTPAHIAEPATASREPQPLSWLDWEQHKQRRLLNVQPENRIA